MHELPDPTLPRETEDERLKREAREQRARDQEESDWKGLMGTKQGRRIAWRLLDRSGYRSSSFSTNSMQMAFNEGARRYGQDLHDLFLTVCPDLFIKMLEEHKK